MTAKARFNEFLQDIEPSTTTTSNAVRAHTNMRDFLEAHDVIGMRHVHTFLSGSYKRDTAIRPRIKNGQVSRPDVDIIMITDHTLQDAPVDVLDELHEAILDGYDDAEKQFRSVGVKIAAAEMDVVPVIQPYGEGGGLYIPDRNLEKWLLTNPPGHTQWTIDRNAAANGRFKPLVKMFKWWRRFNHDEGLITDRRPKGFILECIVADCMDNNEVHYGELFTKMLENTVRTYGPYFDAGMVPHIEDPGVPGNNVMSNVTFSEFSNFFKVARAHATLARTAMTTEDGEIWRTIFGPRFPVTVEKATQDSNVKFASVAGMGAVGSGSPQFPNHPVTPNKTKGFA